MAWRGARTMRAWCGVVLVVACGMVAKAEVVVHKNLSAASEGSGGVGPSTNSPSASTPAGHTDPRQDEEDQVVRCHCNLPRCVSVGYMCKSVGGACFTHYTPPPTHAYAHTRNPAAHPHRWAPMHGCLELLPPNRHAECLRKRGRAGSGPPSTPPSGAGQAGELTCCGQDMCNYHDIDVYIKVEGGAYHHHHGNTGGNRGDSDGQVVTGAMWFRAATIAVPIAGGFILILLIFMATRMLSKENKRQRMAQVLEEQYLKAPLYPIIASAHLPAPHLCYHPPLSAKSSPLAYINLRGPCYEDNPHLHQYCPPEDHLEELKPLNSCSRALEEQWDQREAECPHPT